MKNIKIKVADFELVVSSKREENEEKSYEKGYENICGCCGKPIKNAETSKSLHLIEGGLYFTEYEDEIDDGSDMGWWSVGPVCYKKYKKNEKEIEL